jgi:probable rRNA maturation factor
MEADSSGIHFAGAGRLATGDAAWLHATLQRCAVLVPGGVRRASIELADDARMRQLHAKFSGDDTTTDVLTFATNEPGLPVDCDMAVCVDEAARNAAELGHTVAQELLLYALHGLLHAAGFDDRQPHDHQRMHAEEDRILTLVGVGPLFRGGSSC